MPSRSCRVTWPRVQTGGLAGTRLWFGQMAKRRPDWCCRCTRVWCVTSKAHLLRVQPVCGRWDGADSATLRINQTFHNSFA